MPAIFRGIHLDPLQPGNSFYLLWMILGFLIVSSVLVVSLGRLGDMYGRVRMYTLGFVIYTVASLLLTIDWMDGRAGADWLIGFRIVQGIGAAFLIANSVAILTDAFPAHPARVRARDQQRRRDQRPVHRARARRAARRRRLAARLPDLGAARDRRDDLVARVAPRDRRPPTRRRSTGGATSPSRGGLVLLMIGITYGIRPYERSPDGLDLAVRARLCRGRVRAARRCSSGSRRASPRRCSSSRSSGSVPTPSASSRASSRRSRAAA